MFKRKVEMIEEQSISISQILQLTFLITKKEETKDIKMIDMMKLLFYIVKYEL
jgi:hypothetical protein